MSLTNQAFNDLSFTQPVKIRYFHSTKVFDNLYLRLITNTHNMFKDQSPFVQLVLAGLIVVATSLLLLIIGAIFAIPLFDYNYFTNPGLLGTAFRDNIDVAKYFQVLNSLGMFVIPPFIIAILFDGRIGSYLAINKTPFLSTVLLTGICMIAALPVIGFSAEINSKLQLPEFLKGIENWMQEMEASALDMTVEFLRMETFSDFVLNMIMIALLPAIGEELLFRGVIQRILGDWFKSHHVAIVITAILFSAFHMQFLSFLPRFLLGVFMGYLLVWTRNIWIPIIAHFVNNAGAVVYYYVSDVDVAEDMANPTTEDFPLYAMFISVVIIAILIRLIIRKERQLV